MKPHRASLILVIGILSLVVCQPLGAAAWILGRNDLKDMDAGIMDASGRKQTRIGKICGMIACLLVLIGSAFFYVLLRLLNFR